MLEHRSFLKIPRLNREITVSEKIDGTNGAIGILTQHDPGWDDPRCTRVSPGGIGYGVYAQSRKSILEWKANGHKPLDNYGFGAWVHANAESLVADLGPGLHFGEWWGAGINRGYDYAKHPDKPKFFSLFNTKRWDRDPIGFETAELMVVPVLYQGRFDCKAIDACIDDLRLYGSVVANTEHYPAEGVVIYHSAANTLFKVTLLNDELPKGLVETE